MADLSLGAQFAPGNAFAIPFPLTRTAIEDHVEALVALLDAIDGDFDLEEDSEDCCAARDDTGGRHPNDGYGDGQPGDPADCEDGDQDCCAAMDDDPTGMPGCKFDGPGDPVDAEEDFLDQATRHAARRRRASRRVTPTGENRQLTRSQWWNVTLGGCATSGADHNPD